MNRSFFSPQRLAALSVSCAIVAASMMASAQDNFDEYGDPTAQDTSGPAPDITSPIDPARTDDDPERDPEIDENYPDHAHFAFKTNASAALRVVYGSAIGGFEGDLSFGSETRRGAFYASVRLMGGRTEGGLTVGQFSAGPTFEWPIGIVRLGFKPRIGYLWIERVTSDSSMDALSLGLSGVFSADIFRDDGLAVAVGVEPVIEGLLPFFEIFDEQTSAAMYGANAFLQFRLRAPRRPSEAPSSVAGFSMPSF